MSLDVVHQFTKQQHVSILEIQSSSAHRMIVHRAVISYIHIIIASRLPSPGLVYHSHSQGTELSFTLLSAANNLPIATSHP
jgi:hypothetical protein